MTKIVCGVRGDRLFVLLVVYCYAAIAPLLLPVACALYLGSYLVYKNQALFVYVQRAESGGAVSTSTLFRGVIYASASKCRSGPTAKKRPAQWYVKMFESRLLSRVFSVIKAKQPLASDGNVRPLAKVFR